MLKEYNVKVILLQLFIVVTALLSGCNANLNNLEVTQEEVEVDEMNVEVFEDGKLIPFGEGHVTVSIEAESVKFNVSGEGLNSKGTYSLDFHNSKQPNDNMVPNVVLTKGEKVEGEIYTLKPNSEGELHLSFLITKEDSIDGTFTLSLMENSKEVRMFTTIPFKIDIN